MTDAPDILETAQKSLELSAKATAGPWSVSDDRYADCIESPSGSVLSGGCVGYDNASLGGSDEDKAMACFARNHIEALAREVIRLRGENAEASDWINGPLLGATQQGNV